MKLSKIEVPYGQVPNQVMNDPNLSFKAKGLFAYFQCKPNNWNFAIRRIVNETKDGESAVRAAINELEEAKYLVREKRVDGHMNYNLKLPDLLVETPTCENLPQEKTSRYIKKDNNIKKDNTTITNVIVEAEPTNTDFGNSDINWIMKTFEEIMGFPSSGSKDRFFARHVLNNFNKEQIQGMLLFCANYEYSPNIGSVQKLWYKRGDIVAGIKKIKQTARSVRSL